MRLINIPNNFNELTLKAKVDVLIEEYFDEFSIAKIVNATFESELIPLLDKEFEDGATLSIQDVIKKTIPKVILKHMGDWYRNEVFEEIEEYRIYFDLNQLSDDDEVNQVDFIEKLGQKMNSYIYQIIMNKSYNSYIGRRNVKNYMLAVYGLNTNKMKISI